MSRLPLMTYDQTDERQRALWDAIVASRGGALRLTTDEGRLAGPFESFVRRPALGEHLIEVGSVVRFESSLDDRLLELAISTVGARWRSEFEFWAHSRLALDAGLSESVIDSLAAGDRPSFDDPTEEAVYDYAWALSNDGRVADTIYDAAVDVIGVDAVVDLTHTIGYYTHICFILNTFEVQLPPGANPRFDAN